MGQKVFTAIIECPSVKEFCDLRVKAGWGQIDLDLARTALENSLFHVVVRNRGKLIGMGRVIGDGALNFYIQDIVVDPGFQKQGIGTAVMAEIERCLRSVARKGSTIGLLAAKGKEDFYARFDYVPRPSDGLGNGMCKFV